SSTEEWVDFDSLNSNCQMTTNPQWCVARFSELERHFQRWFWVHPVDATVAAALAVCTWVQTILPWRPEVAITAPSGAGKSTLLKSLLAPLYGRLAMYTDQSSEAGIRQAIQNRSVAIILDEFEKSRERPKILQLFRSTSRGAVIRRGTADQRGMRF